MALAAAWPSGLILRNREGEPALLCEARFEGRRLDAKARAALRGAGLEQDEEDGALRLSHPLSEDESIVDDGGAAWGTLARRAPGMRTTRSAMTTRGRR